MTLKPWVCDLDLESSCYQEFNLFYKSTTLKYVRTRAALWSTPCSPEHFKKSCFWSFFFWEGQRLAFPSSLMRNRPPGITSSGPHKEQSRSSERAPSHPQAASVSVAGFKHAFNVPDTDGNNPCPPFNSTPPPPSQKSGLALICFHGREKRLITHLKLNA